MNNEFKCTTDPIIINKKTTSFYMNRVGYYKIKGLGKEFRSLRHVKTWIKNHHNYMFMDVIYKFPKPIEYVTIKGLI